LKFDFRKFKAPFLSREDIWRRADAFRGQHGKGDAVPVDVLAIAELSLGLDVVPVRNFGNTASVVALLLGGGDAIMVDYDHYMRENLQSRLRFSVAHEIGHLVLHADLYRRLELTSVEDWVKFVQSIPEEEYRWIEYHAYEFAGRLLVPPNVLRQELASSVRKALHHGLSRDMLSSDAALEHISSTMCRRFGVSGEVILRRIEKEGLWPPPANA
jgi:hypothetical protein